MIATEKSNLLVRYSYVNKTKGHRFGQDGPIESFTSDRGELYRSCLKEFGRCTSKIYVDVLGDPAREVGWVFERHEEYGDSGERYLREVWVEVVPRD
jgi:hypothetical protein